jgi:hypothetical protein
MELRKVKGNDPRFPRLGYPSMGTCHPGTPVSDGLLALFVTQSREGARGGRVFDASHSVQAIYTQSREGARGGRVFDASHSVQAICEGTAWFTSRIAARSTDNRNSALLSRPNTSLRALTVTDT